MILHLRDGEDDFLSDARLKAILRKYSDHIAIPIVMQKLEWSEEKKETVATGLEETVNQASALWARPKSEITEEQYQEFYRTSRTTSTRRSPGPTTASRAARSTRSSCTSPRARRSTCGTAHHRRGLKLYVRRVFIMDDAEHLLPAYLRFVRGVVDSNDLPLNVSREILQESRDVEAIRSGCTRRALQLLEELAGEPAGEVRDVLEGVRPGAEGGYGRGRGEPRADREAAAASLPRTPTPTSSRCRSPTTSGA